jgi:hypothetical protein
LDANTASSASYSSLLLLGPHFCAQHSPPHPADRCLHAVFLVGDHSSRDTAQARGPLEGAPAALVVGHAATDDGDGHSPLRQSLCMMLQNRGYQFGSKGLLAQKRNGTAAQNGTNTKPAQTNRHKQTGANQHKLEHLFVLRRGEAHLPPFSAGEQHNRPPKKTVSVFTRALFYGRRHLRYVDRKKSNVFFMLTSC